MTISTLTGEAIAIAAPLSLRRVGWMVQFRKSSVASYRLRCARVLPHLASSGVLSQLLTRRNCARYAGDAVIFQKSYSPDSQAAAMQLRARGVRLILDLCDHHLLTLPGRRDLIERREQLLKMLDLVDIVTCATPTLAEQIPHAAVQIVDDLLDDPCQSWWANLLARWQSRLGERDFLAKPVTRVIWYGHAGADFPPFGLCDLSRVLPMLTKIHSEHPLTLTVVSNSRPRFRQYVSGTKFPVRYINWRSWKMPSLLGNHDVCIIPVGDNPFSRCKSANRPAYALQCGIPVAAELIPSYAELADFMEAGDLEQGLRTVISQPEIARRKVQCGQAFLRERFSPAIIAAQWVRAIDTAVGAKRSSK